MFNVLITGSSSGIGLETANVLRARGFNVFQTGRRQLDIENYLSIELSCFEHAKMLYEKTIEKFGSIDILINNAGEYFYSPIERVQPYDIERVMLLNLSIPYYMASLCVSQMKEKGFGRIINISSISASVGEANASLYAATKAGMYGMTKSLALELAQYNITVNCISPGWVETALMNDINEEDKAEILDVVPQRRFIQPVEISNLIRYLISEKAKGLTGQNINLCAGLSVGS